MRRIGLNPSLFGWHRMNNLGTTLLCFLGCFLPFSCCRKVFLGAWRNVSQAQVTMQASAGLFEFFRKFPFLPNSWRAIDHIESLNNSMRLLETDTFPIIEAKMTQY